MLSKLFSPRSVAVIGASATPGKLGFDLLENLVNSNYSGKIYPVNPKAKQILGKKAYSSVASISGQIDLAIVAVPAPLVLKILHECVRKKIRNMVVISAGFKESNQEGVEREAEIQRLIKKHNLVLVGPNCLGILNTYEDLNASFAEGLPKRGNVALISQSGAMAVAITDWADAEEIGFSKIISLGNKAGINENDCLEYLLKDPETKVIALYLESFVDGKKFMEIARKVALKKPIILFKSGVSEAGTKAVASHTGALAGSDTAVETALRQCGVLRAETIEDFFDCVRVFSMQPLPLGNRVAIVTNAGGPGVIATDAIEKSPWLNLAEFKKETSAHLQKTLPKTANIHNPVDVVGDALANRYTNALEGILPDSNVDIALVILTPQIMTEKERTAKTINQFHEQFPKKPILTAFMGGRNIEYAALKLAERNIPNFLYPTRAVKAMEKMVWLKSWRSQLSSQKLKVESRKLEVDNRKLKGKVKREYSRGGQLSSKLSRALLEHYDITVPNVQLARNEKEALKCAKEIGCPVVLKISSDEVLHKTDVGGVRLALKNEEEVQKGYREVLENIRKNVPKAKVNGVFVQKMYHFGREVIVGMKRDPVFGPLIMFGLGGIYVEVMKDVSFRVAPFSLREAEKMIHEVTAIQLLKGVRGEAPADIKKLADTILRVSELAFDFPEIQELDINPLLVMAKGKGVMAVDVRIIC